jgi:hypothetical protein
LPACNCGLGASSANRFTPSQRPAVSESDLAPAYPSKFCIFRLSVPSSVRYDPFMPVTSPPSEAEIIEKVVAPRSGRFSAEAARAILTLAFDRPTTNRIRQLLKKNNQGTISADDRLALDRYLRVGQLFDLLHAKARLSLKGSANSR